MSIGVLYLIYEVFDSPWAIQAAPPMLRFLAAVMTGCVLAGVFIPQLPYYPKTKGVATPQAKSNEPQLAPEIKEHRDTPLLPSPRRKVADKSVSPKGKEPRQPPPPPTSQHLYDLTNDRRKAFLTLLAPPSEDKDTLRIGCTTWSESSCVAAGRFLVLLSEAGWSIDSNKVFRLEPSIPIEGIAIVTPMTKADSDTQKTIPPHMGTWQQMDKSHR